MDTVDRYIMRYFKIWEWLCDGTFLDNIIHNIFSSELLVKYRFEFVDVYSWQ